MPNICAIAIGSNLGDSLQIVNAALADLDMIPTIHVIKRSPWYRTKAITQNMATTASLQPDYVNGCAILSTTLSPVALLAVLLDVEMRFGRVRREKWDARTLDLDLLLYENYVLDTPNLIIPHPRMCDRAFVLLPLAQIAPDWIHPITGEAIAAIHPPDIELSCPQLITI